MTLFTHTISFIISILYLIQYLYSIQFPCMAKFIEALLHAGTTNHQDYDYGYLPYILALASSILWPLGWIYSNENNLPMCQSTMIRGISTLIFNYIFCRAYNCGIAFSDKTTFSLLVFRSLIISLTSLAIGFSQFVLPLSIAHTIISSSTLFVFLIDYFANNIKINLKQGLGIAIGVLGMLLAANGRVLSLWMDSTY